jgi:acetyltransferase-like isoleucine patch superfamily enzyme
MRGYFIKQKYLRKNVGKRTYIDTTVQVHGWANLRIGENCTIGERTLITVNNRSRTGERIEIGSNSYIGRNNFFSSGIGIIMREFTMTGNNCAFVSSNHAFDDPRIPYALSGNTDGGVIEIGVNCWFGIGASVIGNVKIGHGSIIGANSLISKDVPPFSIVVGNPQKVIKQYDFKKGVWVRVDDATADFSSTMDEAQYLAMLKKKYPNTCTAYHSGSSRFGDL